MKFLLLVSVLFIINIASTIIQFYQPVFFGTALLTNLLIIIPLLINSIMIILAFYFYSLRSRPQSCANTIELVQEKTIKLEPELKLDLAPSPSPTKYTDLLLIENFPNILCIKDQNGRWLQASSEYIKAINIQYVDYFSKTDAYLALNSNGNNSVFQENIIQDKKAWEKRKGVRNTMSLTLDNGNTVQLETLTTPIFDDNNRPFRLFITGQLGQKSLESKNELALFTTIFSTSHISFIILDGSFKITNANAAFSSLFGYSFDEVNKQLISYITSSKHKQKFCEKIQTYFKENEYQLWSGEVECKNKNEELILIKLKIKPVQTENEAFDNYFVTLEDITLSKENENRILRIANYDHLTGLVNRAMFMDRMAQFISAAGRHNLTAVIFFLDLDKFKIVNDTYGHDAGDEVLKITAQRLLKVLRKEDVIARFSGDEFAILLLNEKSHGKAIFSSSLVAEKIIKSLSEKIHFKRRELFVGSSIGISIFPEDGTTSEELLKHADVAMYEAKNKGRNNYQFYKEEFGLENQGRLELEINLRKAMQKGELQLFYQPQINARTREISGAEVLIRWFQDPHGKNKMIPPDHFIPIAEETGLIIEIGAWILKTACVQCKSWLVQGFSIPQVSVNVSARQFMDEGFMKSVEDALKNAELEAKYLELEITESMLIGDLDRIERQLDSLKEMDIKIALDDFGTGYSSLSYLKKFPIDVLKIDQSFIRELTIGSKDASIASAIIEMGHSLNQKIVAEGVENELQLMFLIENKCDFIQGYYFSKPLPVFKMATFLKEYSLSP